MSTPRSADIVICGAGMAGAAAAYHLAVRHGAKRVVLIDEREPITLTSDKGTQAYRNWFGGPGDAMVRFMNRSIDLLEALAEESGNAFDLQRRGYLFVTGNSAHVEKFRASGLENEALGAGTLREHPGALPYHPAPAHSWKEQPTGADLITDRALMRDHFPYVTDRAAGMLHVRRAGSLDAPKLGEYLLARARDAGVVIVRDRMTAVESSNGGISGVALASGDSIRTGILVLTPGPLLQDAGRMLGIELRVSLELHGKLTLQDHLGVIPRDSPMTIWSDPVELEWSPGERERLFASPDGQRLTSPMPSGIHVRPRDDGRPNTIFLIWTYHLEPEVFAWPPQFDANYGEAVIRALAHMIPGMRAYFGKATEAYVDGGYYCKTPENRPLVGPLEVRGAYVAAALSGYGIMASQAAGDLVAAHVMGSDLPTYERWFRPDRYENPEYRDLLGSWDALSGQL